MNGIQIMHKLIQYMLYKANQTNKYNKANKLGMLVANNWKPLWSKPLLFPSGVAMLLNPKSYLEKDKFRNIDRMD